MDRALLPVAGGGGTGSGKKLGTRFFLAARYADDEQITEEEAGMIEQIFLAERMHWTLDYVESLDPERFFRVQEILRARDAAVKPLPKGEGDGSG